MPVITITSDYGITDHYLAALKGALLSEAEGVTLIDISHTIEPGNLFEAAFILRNSYAHFPKGTVHLIAFQEISNNGKLLAAEMDGHFFLVADNGLLPMINPDIKIRKIIDIDFRQETSLFPARDVLVRSANHLARSGSIDLLGREFKDIVQKVFMKPRIADDNSSVWGSIVYIDNFGNIISNITYKLFKEVGKDRDFEIVLPRNNRIGKICDSYFSVAHGSILALFNSQNLLEVAISGSRGKHFNGANTLLGIEMQNTITINFK